MESNLHAAHTRAAAFLDAILTGDISDGHRIQNPASGLRPTLQPNPDAHSRVA
jgi:hypothetical protein